MNTARFKRFELSEALLKDSAIYTHLPEENMLIIGKVISIDDLMLRGGKVVAYNTRNALVYDAPVDKKVDLEWLLMTLRMEIPFSAACKCTGATSQCCYSF